MRLAVLSLLVAACGGAPAPIAEAPPPTSPSVPVPEPTATPEVPKLAPIAIPADGKYEMVKVDGVTMPMINIMDGGATVLVDTDGVKPRSWEEQYKRKSADLPVGYFDVHKTNVNHDDGFEDDEIDRMGRWKMDGTGAITRD